MLVKKDAHQRKNITKWPTWLALKVFRKQKWLYIIYYLLIIFYTWLVFIPLYVSIPADNTPPTILSCPLDIALQKVNHAPLKVTWEAPSATDLFGNVTLMSQSHSPGDEFDVGIHNVTYAFTDDSGNVAYCVFGISVVEGNSWVFISICHTCTNTLNSNFYIMNTCNCLNWSNRIIWAYNFSKMHFRLLNTKGLFFPLQDELANVSIVNTFFKKFKQFSNMRYNVRTEKN